MGLFSEKRLKTVKGEDWKTSGQTQVFLYRINVKALRAVEGKSDMEVFT